VAKMNKQRIVRYGCPACSIEVFAKPGLNLGCMNCCVGLCEEEALSEMKKLRAACYETRPGRNPK
jgi:hypothetical protein